jgi:hypothetical protein
VNVTIGGSPTAVVIENVSPGPASGSHANLSGCEPYIRAGCMNRGDAEDGLRSSATRR